MRGNRGRVAFLAILQGLLPCWLAAAVEYPYAPAEPQPAGWPLTAEERTYITERPEHDRRPGREANQHLPQLWPVVPAAGFFGGDAWLRIHEAHVKTVQETKGPMDVLLVGDSITQQWGDSWARLFPGLRAINIGIGGDKTQNVLWRLDHGGVDGLEPRAIVLMIGNNNMFFAPETGVEAASRGIEMCVKNLRERFPDSRLILTTILPAHQPGHRFFEDIRRTNEALRSLGLDADPAVTLLDLTADFSHPDGTLKTDLFTPDAIHLTPAGYAVYAERLRPLLPKPAAAGRPDGHAQYLLLNYSTALDAPSQTRDLMGYVRDTFGAANEASRLKVGVAVIYTPRERLAETAARLKADLAVAQELGVPILVQVDTENWLPASLTNWFDPAKPGYDPSKVHDVEWYGWTPDTAVKVCWRNWGRVVRVGPHPNLLSPRFQAWERSIYAALAPVVVEWLAALPADRQWLFVGWKCGWETMPNSQYAYFKDGNAYLDRADDPAWRNEDKQIIGYNAARVGGFQTSGVLDFEQGHDVFMKIVGAHLSFLASTARSLGLPREKLFVHTIVQGVDRYNLDSQFNADSNPSPSYYGKPTETLRGNASFMRCLATGRQELGVTGYGIGEFAFGARDYDTWHRWFGEQLAADPDCIFAALYNYDTLKGRPPIERALLDVMAASPQAAAAD